jgi:hypothetical protein
MGAGSSQRFRSPATVVRRLVYPSRMEALLVLTRRRPPVRTLTASLQSVRTLYNNKPTLSALIWRILISPNSFFSDEHMETASYPLQQYCFFTFYFFSFHLIDIFMDEGNEYDTIRHGTYTIGLGECCRTTWVGLPFFFMRGCMDNWFSGDKGYRTNWRENEQHHAYVLWLYSRGMCENCGPDVCKLCYRWCCFHRLALFLLCFCFHLLSLHISVSNGILSLCC